MLALVDLYLCIHRILLHYLIKICVIFLNIFCNNLLLPAKPRLKKKTSRVLWPTLTFVTSSVNQQSPKISQTMDNGMYLPLSWALAHNSYFWHSSCYCDWKCVSWYCVKYVMLCVQVLNWEVGTYHCPLFGLSWVTVDWLMRSQKSK